MELSVSHQPGCLVVAPKATDLRFDVSTDFKQALFELIAAHDTHMVLDLSNVEFVDSTALSAFIAAKSRLAVKGRTLVLCGDSKGVSGVLRLTSLDSFLNLRPNLQAALAALPS